MSETTPTYSQAEIKHPIVSIVGFFELTAGRAVTAGGAIVAFYLMCIYVSPLVGLEGYMWAILSPFAAFTVVVAVLKPGGHYLEWWILRKIENLFRPSVLLYKRREADNPLKKVRDSVQDALPIEDIEWNWIKAEDGTRLIVFRVEPYAVSLASEQEMRKLWDAAKQYYRGLDFEVIEFKRQRPGTLERYGRRYEEAAAATIEATEDASSRDALAAFAGAHLSFAAELPLHHELRDLTAYLIIPYNPLAAQAGRTASYDPRGLLSALSRKPTTFETSREQSMDEDAFRTISGRAQVVYEGLSAMGCRATPLSENELLAFFASLSTDCEEDPDDPPRPDEPIMLDAGGYADLSEERIAENARRAEKIREESPPAVGAATLGIKEAVSPDAVVREPDRLKVGGRHRKTRYIDRWCEDAHFGILDCLQAVNGRISTLTYIWPKSDEEAEELFGTRLAEMDASLDSDKYGDQRSLSHKQNTRYAAQIANDQITNKLQGYVRVSVLVHMEADTEEDLDAVDAAVERALRGRSIESRLAREEAWEGYLSSLPLGKMRLRASTDRSMLTNALACTFSYTTPYLQHDDGILIGVEASGSALIYNDWKLSSPGSVTLGPPESGKTFWAKADMTRKRGRGRRIVVLDPAANSYYGRVARRLGGEYAFLRNRSPHKVNPFDIGESYMDLALLADALEEGEDSYQDALQKARESAFDAKIASLLKILALMAGTMTRAESGFAMKVFKECYRRAGVTEDPATHTREMPTFSGGAQADFFTVLRELRDESPEIADSLAENLMLWESGPMAELFDAQTNVDFSNKFLVLQVASLDEESKPPVMAAIMESVSGMLSNPNEHADFYIDESHVMLYSDDSARILSDWQRTSRVRATQMHYISQDTIEFTDSKWGKAILKQVGAAWVFRQNNDAAADEIAGIYGLSAAERDEIMKLPQGVCQLIAGKSRYTVSVESSAHERMLFDTNPGAESRWREYQGALAEEDKTAQPAAGATADEDQQAPPDTPEAQTHEEDDTGELPAIVVGHEPEADSYLEKEQSYNELVPLPGESESEAQAGQVYAFSGEGAASSAGSVAKVLGARARHKGLYVLAVDATTPGGELTEALGLEGEADPPDQYLALGETDLEALGSYVSPVYSDSPALMAAASPEMDALPAAPLIQAARQIFDLIVVACGASASVYSQQWLLAADRVVGCSVDSARGALEAATAAEEVRGTNGTLLATHSEASDAAELDGELEGRALFGSLMDDTDARIRLIEKLITESEGSSESSIQEEVTHE